MAKGGKENGGFAAEGVTAAALLAAAAAAYKKSKNTPVDDIVRKFSPIKGGMGLEMNGGRRRRVRRGGEGEGEEAEGTQQPPSADLQYAMNTNQAAPMAGGRKRRSKKKGGFLKEFFQADNFNLPTGGNIQEKFTQPGELPISPVATDQPGWWQTFKDQLGADPRVSPVIGTLANSYPAAAQGFASYDWNTPGAAASRATIAAQQNALNFQGPTVGPTAVNVQGQNINAALAVQNQDAAIKGLNAWLSEVKSVEAHTKLPFYQSDLNNLDKIAFDTEAATYLKGYPNATTMPWHKPVLNIADGSVGTLGNAGGYQAAPYWAPPSPSWTNAITTLGAKSTAIPGAMIPGQYVGDDGYGNAQYSSPSPGPSINTITDKNGITINTKDLTNLGPGGTLTPNTLTDLTGPSVPSYQQVGAVSPTGGVPISADVLAQYNTGQQSLAGQASTAWNNNLQKQALANQAQSSGSWNWNQIISNPNTTIAQIQALNLKAANDAAAATASTAWNQNLQNQAAAGLASASLRNQIQYCEINPSDPVCNPAANAAPVPANAAPVPANAAAVPVPANAGTGTGAPISGGGRRKGSSAKSKKLLAGAVELGGLLESISKKLANQQLGGKRRKAKKGGDDMMPMKSEMGGDEMMKMMSMGGDCGGNMKWGGNVLESAANAITGGNMTGGKKKRSSKK